jgi:hypothetical protein
VWVQRHDPSVTSLLYLPVRHQTSFDLKERVSVLLDIGLPLMSRRRSLPCSMDGPGHGLFAQKIGEMT